MAPMAVAKQTRIVHFPRERLRKTRAGKLLTVTRNIDRHKSTWIGREGIDDEAFLA